MTQETSIDWESDVPKEAPKTIQQRLADLVEEVLIEQDKADAANTKLEEANQRIAELKRVLIPGVMEELGFEEIKLEDKTKIKVEPKVNASIKKENEQIVFGWLVENGFGGLIKSTVTAEFAREEIERAQEIVASLQDEEVDAVLKQGVHAATMKSFVTEQLQAGNKLPEEISVFEYKEAKITLPKSKK